MQTTIMTTIILFCIITFVRNVRVGAVFKAQFGDGVT
jgi:hypothetical protein